MSAEELGRLADGIHQQAKSLLSGHNKLSDLEVPYRMSKAEMDGGRGTEAILDLVRADEKVVSAALGPNQSKVFLDRVNQLLDR
jgi:hypothetical protein